MIWQKGGARRGVRAVRGQVEESLLEEKCHADYYILLALEKGV